MPQSPSHDVDDFKCIACVRIETIENLKEQKREYFPTNEVHNNTGTPSLVRNPKYICIQVVLDFVGAFYSLSRHAH